jgi:thioredoxin 1
VANLKQVDDGTFSDEVLDSDRPVLVDFWADWCRPCKIIEPHLEQIAGELKSKLKVVGLDMDKNPGTANQFGVLSIPTLLLIAEGSEKARIVGARPKQDILAAIEPHL